MKNILFFLSIFISSNLFSQTEKVWQLETFDKNKVQYGFYMGLHQKGYAITATDAKIGSGAGFHVGVLAEKKISEFVAVSINPGLISSANTLTIKNTDIDFNNTYLNIPFILHLRTKRINNTRPCLSIGTSYNRNFKANQYNLENGNKPNDFILKKNVMIGEIGIGTSIYFPYFIFTPSIKSTFALQNEYQGLGIDAKNSISKLSSRGVFITLTFE